MTVSVASKSVEIAVVVELACVSFPVHQIVVDSFSYVVAHLRRHIERCLQSAVVGVVVRWSSMVLALLSLLDSIILAVIAEAAFVRLMLVRNS